MEQTFRPHLRLTILQILEAQAAYQTNDRLLIDTVRASGLKATADQVRTELGWLSEQGLVTRKELDPFTLVTATERGAEVAVGVGRVNGVQRPGP